MAGVGLSSWRVWQLMCRRVAIELLRKKDLYVVVFLMSVFALGALAARIVGVDDDATSAFLLNLGLSLAHATAHVLTLLLAVRQLPDEMENRTLYALLAGPVSRGQVLLGKWLACTLCGTAVFILLFLLGWLPAPAPSGGQGGALVQVLALTPLSLGLTAALGVAGSLYLPRGVLLVLAGAVLFLGDKAVGLAVQAASHTAWAAPARWLTAYLPDFSRLNLITRYTDGVQAVALSEFAGLLLYAAIFTAFSLAAGLYAFERRPL